MKKRLLASLMALCLIVGLLPTAVLAVEEPQDLQEETACLRAGPDCCSRWLHRLGPMTIPCRRAAPTG